MIVLGVLGASALVALVVASKAVDIMLVAGGVLGVAGLFFWLRSGERNPLGILAIAATAGMVNFVTLPTGSGSRLVISLVVTLGIFMFWLLDILTKHRSLRLVPSPLNAPILAWVVVSIVSFAWSTLLRDPLVYVPRSFIIVQAAALLVNILLPLLILLVLNTVVEVRWLYALVAVVLGVATVAMISERFNLPIGSAYENGTRGLFGMWALILAVALALIDKQVPSWLRLGLLGLAGLWGWHYFFNLTSWLSGWLPMAVALAVFLFYHSKRLFVVAALFAVAALVWKFPEIYLMVFVANVEEGSMSRLDIWKMAMSHVVRHPLLGMGPAGYAVYNMTYHPLDARSTHNNYFDIVAQTGIIGLGVFLWMLATVFMTGVRTLTRLARRPGFETALAAAVLAGSVGTAAGMMLGDWVLPFAYNQTISGFDNAAFTWLLFGALGAVSNLTQRRDSAAVPEGSSSP